MGNGCGSFCVWQSPIAVSIPVPTGTAQPAVLPSEDTATSRTPLGTVACASQTECFIGGTFGIEETTDGVNYVPVAWEIPAITHISCGSSLNCLAVTTTGSLTATTDGGRTWLNRPTIEPGNCTTTGDCKTASDVACYSASSCLVSFADVYYPYGDSNSIYLTTDLGLTWTSLRDYSFYYSCALGTSTCAGVGNLTNPWQVDVTSNGGGSWPTATGTIPASGNPDAIACGSASMCLAVGTQGSRRNWSPAAEQLDDYVGDIGYI